MIAHKKLIYFFLFGFFILSLAWEAMLYLLPAHNTLANYVFNLFSLNITLAGILAIYTSYKMNIHFSIGKVFLLLGIAFESYSIGNIIWFFYNVLGNAAPYPSPADFFYLLFVPCMIISFILFFSRLPRAYNARILLETTIVAGMSIFCIFSLLNPPDLSPWLPPLTKFVNLLYPLGDTLLIPVSYYFLRIAQGTTQRSVYLLIIGIICWITADISFTYMQDHNLYWNGSFPDFFYNLSYFFFSWATIELYYIFFKDKLPVPSPSAMTHT